MNPAKEIPILAASMQSGVVVEWVGSNLSLVEEHLTETLFTQKNMVGALETGLITEQEFVDAVLDRTITWLELKTKAPLHEEWDPWAFQARLYHLASDIKHEKELDASIEAALGLVQAGFKVEIVRESDSATVIAILQNRRDLDKFVSLTREWKTSKHWSRFVTLDYRITDLSAMADE